MSFAREASKLFTNKYFLYFMVFLAATNMLGYLVTNKLNALIFFALVGVLTFQFSKNMAVVLLVAIIATNFMMSSKFMREGLENPTDSSSSTTDDSSTDSSNNLVSDKVSALKEKVASGASDKVAAVKDKVASVKDKVASVKDQVADNNSLKDAVTTALADTNNPELNNNSIDVNDVEGFGEKFSNNKKGGNVSNVAPRIDYAATIDQSYQQLDELLGSDSLKNLSADTQKLMSQQQQLFTTMQQMAPVLEGAKSMLETFDIKGLTDSLKGMTSLKNLPNVMAPNK